MLYSRSHGLTLLELLVTLAIVAILSFSAPPALSIWLHKQAAHSVTFRIVQLVQLARINAVQNRTPVVICGSRPTEAHCLPHWEEGILVFEDSNQNGLREETERVIVHESALTHRGILKWSAAFGKTYFRALPSGRVSYAGSFTYCSHTQDPQLTTHIIISAMGRPRIASDTNNDGIVENARGKPVKC